MSAFYRHDADTKDNRTMCAAEQLNEQTCSTFNEIFGKLPPIENVCSPELRWLITLLVMIG